MKNIKEEIKKILLDYLGGFNFNAKRNHVLVDEILALFQQSIDTAYQEGYSKGYEEGGYTED